MVGERGLSGLRDNLLANVVVQALWPVIGGAVAALLAFLADAGPLFGILIGLAVLLLGETVVLIRRGGHTTKVVDNASSPAPPAIDPAEPGSPRTPEDLWRVFDGLTDLQAGNVIRPFIGQPMTIAGPIDTIGPFDTILQVTLERRQFRWLFFVFKDEKWVAPLSLMKKGDQVTIRGTIERVTRIDLQLTDCELVS